MFPCTIVSIWGRTFLSVIFTTQYEHENTNEKYMEIFLQHRCTGNSEFCASWHVWKLQQTFCNQKKTNLISYQSDNRCIIYEFLIHIDCFTTFGPLNFVKVSVFVCWHFSSLVLAFGAQINSMEWKYAPISSSFR